MVGASTITNEEFLEALADTDWKNVPVASGDDSWWVRPAGKVLRTYGPDTSNYYCVSLFKPSDQGKFVRRKELFTKQFVFVVDDVGTKLNEALLRPLLPSPSYELETSPGNFQWGFKLTDGSDPRALAALVDAIVRNEDVNPSLKDPGMTGVTRVVRLPVGANNKPKIVEANGGPFRHVLHVWEPQRAYVVAALAATLGVDLDEEALAKWSEVPTSACVTGDDAEADNVLRLFDIKGMIIDATPNDNGFITVRCPWSDEHSDAREEAGYRPGLGGFQCHHGHCQDRTMNDVRAWFADNATPAEQAEALRDTFGAVDPEDPALRNASAPGRDRQEKIEEVFADWAFVKKVNRYAEISVNLLLPREVFNSVNLDLAPAGASGRKAASSVFLNGGGVIATEIDYAPGKPPLFRRSIGGVKRVVYNTWRPGPIGPWIINDVTEADIKDWLDHVHFIFPDKVARDLFLNWCAFQLQFPGEKINWAFTLIGGQGVGKDMVLSPVMAILGDNNYAPIKARDIEGQWTDWAESQVVVLEELPPFHKKDLYEHLKAFVSTAQKMLRINKKGLAQYFIYNLSNWFIFSNHDDALALESDDRRYFVYKTPAEKREPAYYSRLAKRFRDPVLLAKIAAWLMARDLSKFDPGEAPPWTDAKMAMVEAARDPAEQWIEEQFEPFGLFHRREIVRVNEMLDAVRNPFGSELHPLVGQKVTPKKIAAALRRHKWSPLPRCATPKLGKSVFWVQNRPELWTQLRPEKLEERYLVDMKATNSTEDDDERVENVSDDDPF